MNVYQVAYNICQCMLLCSIYIYIFRAYHIQNNNQSKCNQSHIKLHHAYAQYIYLYTDICANIQNVCGIQR